MYLKLKPWPDVAPALASLKALGLRLLLLSNLTQTMLDANIKSPSQITLINMAFLHVFCT